MPWVIMESKKFSNPNYFPNPNIGVVQEYWEISIFMGSSYLNTPLVISIRFRSSNDEKIFSRVTASKGKRGGEELGA